MGPFTFFLLSDYTKLRFAGRMHQFITFNCNKFLIKSTSHNFNVKLYGHNLTIDPDQNESLPILKGQSFWEWEIFVNTLATLCVGLRAGESQISCFYIGFPRTSTVWETYQFFWLQEGLIYYYKEWPVFMHLANWISIIRSRLDISFFLSSYSF